MPGPADILSVDVQQNPAPAPSPDWRDGYQAALVDAIAIIDSLAAPGTGNLSSPMFLRLRSRLAQLSGELSRKAA